MGTEEQHLTDEPEVTEKPEVTDEHRAKAKEMHDAYEEDRPTVTLPGAGGTVAGTAVNDWLDDDGKPKYSDTTKDGDETKDGDQPKDGDETKDGDQP